MKIIDLSQTIHYNMPVFPGDTKLSLLQTRYLKIDGYNDHRLETGMHSGTHMDGPMHLTEDEYYMSDLSTQSFICPGSIIDVRNRRLVDLNIDDAEKIPKNRAILLHTAQDELYGTREYFTDYPVISTHFGELLVRRHVRLLGIDGPSPDVYPYEIHKLLLSHGTLIIENLTNLNMLIGKKRFEIIALPLKIKADSAPARVVARILD